MRAIITKYAARILIIELVLATVLLIGLMVPLPGNVAFKIVQSGSMEPAVPVGSVVVVVPQAQYVVGDIVTFGDDTKKRIPTTHRIVGIERESGATRFVTKGDANEEADQVRTGYGEMVGKVVLTVPRLGYALDFARSERGFIYTIVVPAVLIILDELLTIAGIARGARRRTRSAPALEPRRRPAGVQGTEHPTINEPLHQPSFASIEGVRRPVRTTPRTRRSTVVVTDILPPYGYAA